MLSDQRVITIPYNWEPRDYQADLWNYLNRGGQRAVAVWHRRAGKDLLSINWIAKCMWKRTGLYWHCFPTYAQGRKVAWEGFTKTGRRFLDAFPKELVESTSEKEMRLKLKNRADGTEGSSYQVVGTDAIDRLVGANPIGVVFSEYSLSDPQAWHLIQPILRENGGWAVFIYTPRGHNHGYDLLRRAQAQPDRWFSQVLTVKDSRHAGAAIVDEALIEQDRNDGMPEELIQQEYYCSFDAPLVGAYYSREMAKCRSEGRIGKVPYDPSLPVETYWDLGMDDSTSIWFIQKYRQEIRIIDYLEASGEGLPFYARELDRKNYVYAKHVGPWDLEVREMGTGKSRKEVAYKLGIKFQVAPKLPLEDGIESSRNILNRCWFDEVKCERGIEALCSYQKTFDETKKIYSSSPLHNWASHGADSFRTFAVSFREKKGAQQKKALQTTGLRDYSPVEFGVNNYERDLEDIWWQ